MIVLELLILLEFPDHLSVFLLFLLFEDFELFFALLRFFLLFLLSSVGYFFQFIGILDILVVRLLNWLARVVGISRFVNGGIKKLIELALIRAAVYVSHWLFALVLF